MPYTVQCIGRLWQLARNLHLNQLTGLERQHVLATFPTSMVASVKNDFLAKAQKSTNTAKNGNAKANAWPAAVSRITSESILELDAARTQHVRWQRATSFPVTKDHCRRERTVDYRPICWTIPTANTPRKRGSIVRICQ